MRSNKAGTAEKPELQRSKEAKRQEKQKSKKQKSRKFGEAEKQSNRNTRKTIPNKITVLLLFQKTFHSQNQKSLDKPKPNPGKKKD